MKSAREEITEQISTYDRETMKDAYWAIWSIVLGVMVVPLAADLGVSDKSWETYWPAFVACGAYGHSAVRLTWLL